MATNTDLADAFRLLAAALQQLDDTPGGMVQADEVRARIVAHCDAATAVIVGGKPPECRHHRGQPAHNCSPCAGERKGRPDPLRLVAVPAPRRFRRLRAVT